MIFVPLFVIVTFVIPRVFVSTLAQLPLNCAAGATVAVALAVALTLAFAVAVALVLALAVAVALALDCEDLFEKAFAMRTIPPSTTSSASTVIKTIMPVDNCCVGVGSGVGVGGAVRYTGAGATGSGMGWIACANASAKAETVG